MAQMSRPRPTLHQTAPILCAVFSSLATVTVVRSVAQLVVPASWRSIALTLPTAFTLSVMVASFSTVAGFGCWMGWYLGGLIASQRRGRAMLSATCCLSTLVAFAASASITPLVSPWMIPAWCAMVLAVAAVPFVVTERT